MIVIRLRHVVSPDGRWDAVVIGAGPAGAIAARQLALAGARVLLLDKARLPRDKVCGGCLGGAALNVLESLKLGGLPAAIGGVPLNTFTLACGRTTARISVGRRIAISRRTFDAALVQEAIRAGATFCDQAIGTVASTPTPGARLVTVRQLGRVVDISASVVIVATGLAAPQAGCTNHAAAWSYVGLGAVIDSAPCLANAGDLLMACGASGYVGVTAVEGGRYDVAAAVAPGVLAAVRSPGAVVAGILAEAGRAPIIDLNSVAWRGTPPLTRRVTPLASERCLLIGDAAGYVEPFTGEGIGWGMHSAILATALVCRHDNLWDESIVRLWPQVYAQTFASRQRSCRLLSQSLRISAIRRLLTYGLSCAPALSTPFVNRLDRPFSSFNSTASVT